MHSGCRCRNKNRHAVRIHRETGESIYEIEESLVPSIDVSGEKLPREEFNRAVKNHEMDGWQFTAMKGTPYGMDRRLFLSALDLPCTKPPWGKIAAVDLTTGKVLWNKPFGTTEDGAPAIVPNFEFDVPNLGDPLTTASGLFFIGATMDFYIRAYRTDSGDEVWKYRLPTSADAIPMSYWFKDKQYLAIAVGGHIGFVTPPGDHLMVFTLP